MFAGNIAVMWSRKMGDTPSPLYIDDTQLTEDDRFTLVDTVAGQYDLHITNVEAYDSGEYMCHMATTPEQAQIHQLIVKGGSMCLDILPRMRYLRTNHDELGSVTTLVCQHN